MSALTDAEGEIVASQIVDILETADDNYEFLSTPPDMKDYIDASKIDRRPQQSAQRYARAWADFTTWCISNRVPWNSIHTADVLQRWIRHVLQFYAVTTARSMLAMVKLEISIHRSTPEQPIYADVGFAEQILKKKEHTHKKTQSKVFTRSEIERFWKEGPNEMLDIKAASILSVYGALRKCELLNMEYSDIKIEPNGFLITVRGVKLHHERSYWIDLEDAQPLYDYLHLRPPSCKEPRVMLALNKTNKNVASFLTPLKQQAIGENTIGKWPRLVAEFLGIDPEGYTGHCWRRTCATIASDEGIELVQLKLLGGWKSSTVAEGYVANSIVGKKDRARIISGRKAEPPAKRLCPAESTTYNATFFNFVGTPSFSNCTFTAMPPTPNK